MSTERNKCIERRIVAEALNNGNMAVVDECLSPDFIYHGPGGVEIKGTDDYKKFITGLRSAYPDMHIEILDILAEKELVATRTLCTFTYTPQSAETSLAGRHVSMTGSILDRIEGDKVAETWEFYNRLDLYQQLGLILQNKQSN